MQARSGNFETIAQSFPYLKSSASPFPYNNNIHKILINQIPTIGSNLSAKLDNVFRVFYKNINGLCTDRRSWKFSYKYKTLRKLWKILDPDLILLIEMQINLDLLDAFYNIPLSLF